MASVGGSARRGHHCEAPELDIQAYLTWMFERRGTRRRDYKLDPVDLTPAAYKRMLEKQRGFFNPSFVAVHGEIDALRSLVAHLGYAHEGREHPAGRRLVFVGDLCDRGPDSPAVVKLVSELRSAGVAQCVLGNHEINVLRGAQKHGNAWITKPEHEENTHEYACAVATPPQRATFAAFFRTLPLALERADLRVVHAAWDADAIATLRTLDDDCATTFTRFEEQTIADLARLLPLKQAALAPHRHGLRDETYAMPSLPDVGAYEQGKQTLNPVRRITSGLERTTTTPFFATGEWRFCDRVRWWNEYTDDTAVVFGHYWRVASAAIKGKVDLMAEYGIGDWQGPKRNLCWVDFSVGARFRERRDRVRTGTPADAPFEGRLAAVRWPERALVFADGEVVEPS